MIMEIVQNDHYVVAFCLQLLCEITIISDLAVWMFVSNTLAQYASSHVLHDVDCCMVMKGFKEWFSVL